MCMQETLDNGCGYALWRLLNSNRIVEMQYTITWDTHIQIHLYI